jgi:hypothetical protein
MKSQIMYSDLEDADCPNVVRSDKFPDFVWTRFEVLTPEYVNISFVFRC